MPTLSFDQLGVWTVGFLLALDVALRLAAHFREKRSAEEGSRTMITPQPLVVKPHEEFTPLEKHDALVTRVNGIETSFEDRMTKLAQASSDGREKIYLQLNTQRELLAKNTEKTDLTYAHLQKLDGKMDRVLERLPRTS